MLIRQSCSGVPATSLPDRQYSKITRFRHQRCDTPKLKQRLHKPELLRTYYNLPAQATTATVLQRTQQHSPVGATQPCSWSNTTPTLRHTAQKNLKRCCLNQQNAASNRT